MTARLAYVSLADLPPLATHSGDTVKVADAAVSHSGCRHIGAYSVSTAVRNARSSSSLTSAA